LRNPDRFDGKRDGKQLFEDQDMEKEIIFPAGRDAGSIVFAPATRIGELIFLSGTAGLESSGKLAGDDIESQARQALKNLEEVLIAAGSSWDKVVKVNCFLTHVMRDFEGWNKVFKEFFPENPPARTTVQGSIALEGGLIEVEAMATT
jgi:2-iminobutanoate/2-iminopropanoate deaminase